MPTYTVPEVSSNGDATPLDPGTYSATIQTIESVPAREDSEYGRDQLKITYLLSDITWSDGGDITRWQYVTDVQALDPRSTLYQVFSAVLFGGGTIPPGASLSTDDLIDEPCQIVWGAHVLQAGPSKGQTRMKIKSVLPPEKKGAPANGTRRRAPVEEQIDADTSF